MMNFTYDDAGNRTHRTLVLDPPPTPQQQQDTTDRTDSNSDVVETEEDLSEIEKNFGFEKLGEANIKVYPNPVQGALMVRLENINNVEGTSLQLYNTTGNLLQTQQMSTNYAEFNMQNFAPGLYILRIIRKDENDKLEFKVIKK